MMDQPREMPAYDDLDPMPGQRLPWQHDDTSSRMETDPDGLPGDPPVEDDDEDEDEGVAGSSDDR